jgi:hypothetical protein
MQAYRVKVRGQTFIWGGPLIEKKFEPSSPLYLHFRVDETGERVVLGKKEKKDSSIEQLGALNPGECFTIQLKDVVGIIASTVDPADSYVECSIISGEKIS